MKSWEQSTSQWAERLLAWYREVKRDLPWRRIRDPYAIWVSEVMLQQTQVKTVIPYYYAFLERFPRLENLAQAQLEEVLEIWRGLGYYSRAKNLWRGAGYVLETWGGKIPESYDLLLHIPGVGEYTAAAIASIAYGENVPAIDGNVQRVLARFLAWEEPIERAKTRRLFTSLLKEWQPMDQAGDFNQAMMELGACVCTPNSPRCSECPFLEGCKGYRLKKPLCFPVKRSKEKKTGVTRPTLVIVKDGKVLLKKRPPNGLLANLWEFPGEEILEDKELNPWFTIYQRQIPSREYDEAVREILRQNPPVQGPVVHTFSHRQWTILWIVLDLSGGDVYRENEEKKKHEENPGSEEVIEEVGLGLRWVDEKEMEKIALPVAFQKVWEELVL